MKCSLGAVHPRAGPTNPLRARPPVRRQAGTRGGAESVAVKGVKKPFSRAIFGSSKLAKTALWPPPSARSGQRGLAQRLSVAPRAQPTPARAGFAETAMRVFADREPACARAVDARRELIFEL